MVKFFFDARLQCENHVFFIFLSFERNVNFLTSKTDTKKRWANFSSMLDYNLKWQSQDQIRISKKRNECPTNRKSDTHMISYSWLHDRYWQRILRDNFRNIQQPRILRFPCFKSNVFGQYFHFTYTKSNEYNLANPIHARFRILDYMIIIHKEFSGTIFRNIRQLRVFEYWIKTNLVSNTVTCSSISWASWIYYNYRLDQLPPKAFTNFQVNIRYFFLGGGYR